MLTLKLIFFLFVLGYSVYSLIVYAARRTESRQARHAHQAHSTPVRTLTPAEREALKVMPEAPGAPLVGLPNSDDVFALKGAYRAHGITVQGHTTWHHTIDDVEVVFPFDAQQYAAEVCEAEVVYCGGKALVLRLASGFELLEGAERFKHRKRQLDRWAAGAPGLLPPSSDGTEQQPSEIEVVGQRDETAREMAARNPLGHGLLAACLLVPDLVALLIGAYLEPEDALPWLIGGGLCALGGLYLFWRQPQPGKAGRVNRVRAPLKVRLLPQQDGSMAAGPFILGDLLELQVPDRWREAMVACTKERPEMDVRLDDLKLLRFEHLSVEGEVKLVPPVFWGRHLTLALVGAAFALPLFFIVPLLRDGQLVTALIRQGQPVKITDAQALQSAPPASHTLVTLSGKAHCEVHTGKLDCTVLRWGAQTPEVPAPPPDALVAELTSAQLLQQVPIPGYASIARMLRRMNAGQSPDGDGSYLDALTQAQSEQALSRLASSIKTIDHACATEDDPNGALRRACNDFKKLFIESFEMGDKPRTWADWVQLAATGEVSDDSPVLATGRLAAALRRSAEAVADARADLQRQAFAERVQAAQTGGVLIDVRDVGESSRLPQGPSTVGTREAYANWQRFLAEGAHDFELTGFITPAGADRSGSARWVMDANVNPEHTLQSAMRLIAFALALALALLHGSLFALNLHRASKRDSRLLAACRPR
jgi:hypothetical protein